jgi:murein DD-endopeptidase MepM/ murein hydrolase activator NlpD
MFANPLPGRIQAKEEAWRGTPTFRVTSTFADHVASGRGHGVDIGNGRCGDQVFAMEAGVVSANFRDPGNGAVIVRVRHAGALAAYESGYAHLSTTLVGVGAAVRRGQAIGTVGMTGATACHLHLGMKKNGVEVDSWPLLDQNIAQTGGGVDVIQGTNPTAIVNRKTSVKGNATNFRADPSTANPQLAQFQAGAVFLPDFGVQGQSVSGSALWYAGFMLVNGKQTLGYFHSSTVGELTPVEATGGYTEADVAKAKLDGANEREAAWEAWNTAAQGNKP